MIAANQSQMISITSNSSLRVQYNTAVTAYLFDNPTIELPYHPVILQYHPVLGLRVLFARLKDVLVCHKQV